MGEAGARRSKEKGASLISIVSETVRPLFFPPSPKKKSLQAVPDRDLTFRNFDCKARVKIVCEEAEKKISKQQCVCSGRYC